MTMTWTQLGIALAVIAGIYTLVGVLTELRDLLQTATKGMDKITQAALDAEKERAIARATADRIEAASAHIDDFQTNIEDLLDDGVQVSNCRRCGKNPIGDDANTMYDDNTGAFRLICSCNRRATSQWGQEAGDVIGSWNSSQDGDWANTCYRDIYEIIASDHRALSDCASCEGDCWVLQFGDEDGNTFRIENGCNNWQDYHHTYHMTTESAVAAWESQQADIRRIEEIAAEENR